MFERSRVKWAGVAVAALLAGAVQAQGASTTAAAPGPAAAAPDAAAALKRGRLLYIQCRACHELKADQPHKVGPNLHGVMNRKAAAAEGFAYSTALKGASLTWDKATLDKWIEKPSGLVPGNAMAFAGIASATDRAALISYIEAEAK